MKGGGIKMNKTVKLETVDVCNDKKAKWEVEAIQKHLAYFIKHHNEGNKEAFHGDLVAIQNHLDSLAQVTIDRKIRL